MKDILEFLEIQEENDKLDLWSIHCDPYELFLDAGRIDKDFKVIKKVSYKDLAKK